MTTDYAEPDAVPAVAPRNAGIEAFLAGGFDAAVDAFLSPAQTGHAEAFFGPGCTLRARHDSPGRRPGDVQAAIDAWTNASERGLSRRIRSTEPGIQVFHRK